MAATAVLCERLENCIVCHAPGILPLARELVGRGTAVVLAANSVPAINDITAPELQEVLSQAAGLDRVLGRALAEGSLAGVPSGNDLPVIDLRQACSAPALLCIACRRTPKKYTCAGCMQVSQEVVSAAGDADLIILEGMGRGIETNLHARFRVDALKLGMIKHKEVSLACRA